MLNLARAVYGADAAWRDESELRVYVRRDYGAIEIFDPANNSEQFVEVLAWLLRSRGFDSYSIDCRGVYVTFPAGMGDSTSRLSCHDGTPADIRRAVVEAAIRVANA